MGSFSTLAFVVALTTAADVQLLFFTGQNCPPCVQVKPVVSQLIAQGYPIVQVDVAQQTQLADRFRIQQIPCFVLVVDGQEVQRVVGAQPAQVLAGMIQGAQGQSGPASSPNPSPTIARANVPQGQPVTAPPRAPPQSSAGDEYNGWRDGIGYVTTQDATSAQRRALASTVRLHVDENNSTAVGSGTVIHQQGDSALVLTCGHLFRETGMNSRVKAEVGFPDAPRQVDARVLYYDADKHDVALVVVRTAEPMTVAKLAPAQFRPREGDQVFGVGCGGGDDPSILGTRVKALTNYSGVTKFDTFARPEQGRSGGGLFSAGGQLIGVCNAAAVNVDEGIYAGLESIYMALETNNLREEFAAPSADRFADNRSQVQPPVSPATAGVNLGARTAASNQPIPPRGDVAPLAVPVSTAPPVRSPANTAAQGLEIICVVRSLADPTQTQTVVIKNPSPELLVEIERSRNQAGGSRNQAGGTGPQEIPERWQSVNPATANLRAQSPR